MRRIAEQDDAEGREDNRELVVRLKKSLYTEAHVEKVDEGS